MEAVRSDTQLIAVIHASNVVGTINPVAKIGRLARLRGIPMLVDAAQTAGAMRLDVQSDCMDIMACSGHKGLMGPQGTGVLYIDKGIDFDPLMEGGTGSDSEMLEQPLFLPDKFESGTLNTPGIVALSAAVEYIMERGVDDIREHELKLTTELLEGLKGIQRARVFGPPEARDRMPVVSFNLDGMDPAYVGQCLDDEYGIMTRVGLHCSPMAHKAMGTFPQGSVRASMGCFNSSSDVDRLLEGLSKLAVR
jgi:selenocysteine lyase/cysteine desulfurase